MQLFEPGPLIFSAALAAVAFVLGVVLHYTRVIIALVVFPIVPTHLASRLVLLAWRGTVRRVVPAAAAPARFAPSGWLAVRQCRRRHCVL